MATEVSCGHCQGRLLIETRGVVVACPHCGTHLSIPAPDPVPAVQQQPAPAVQQQVVPSSPNVTPVTQEPPAPPVDVPTPAFTPPLEPAPIDTAPFPVITDFADRQIPPAVTAATEENQEPSAGQQDQVSDSVHLQPDDPVNPDQIGWHSAPNLSLGPEVSQTSPDNPDDGQTQIMEPTHQPQAGEWSPVLGGDPTVVLPSVPVGSGALHFSSTQQFSLADLADEAAKTSPTTVPSAVPPQSVPVFAAASSTPSPDPLTFGAPAASPALPVTFGAAPAAAPPSNPFSFGVAAASDLTAAAPSQFPVFSAAPATAGVVAPASAPVMPGTTVAEEVAGFVENESTSRQKFLFLLLIIVGSYASAVTIVLVYMLIRGQSSALESLPDLVPVVGKNGELSWTYSPPMNDVAPGHVLALGQSRRFGNVKVTPLKVTRGIVQFEHYSGEARLARDPTEPVLKLWVRFENVSRDQTFAPLDPHVLFKRNSINLGQKIQANAFITLEAERKKGKSLFFIFDMPVLSEFRMVGQNLNRTLEPGESVETFIPSEEEARDLNGDLVWRFQFRKGYHPTSKRGVTTLIDVRFNSDEITDERKA